ncbi:alpha/beta fold hydrolase [Pseudaestuariivita rosea]|uniref:alpha/beta fold hydrolase n=1 Tax=Pseudaestuariivita rosea TaxID=2763263 RepID=UPI001ABAF992|nr:alpha/beta hydrolase [Pseudaestuariivita rosea]
MTFSLLLSTLALAGCGAYVDQRADKQEIRATQSYPPTGRFVDVDGTRVHAHIEGRGPDLILIHGASGNTRDFTFDFVDRVKDRYRVIAFDRPGLGWTERLGDRQTGPINTRAETPAQQARLLKAAADQLGVRDPIILGHSYGGAIALAWALEFSDHPAALVPVSAASNPWPGGLGPLYAVNSSRVGGAVVVPLITAFAPKDRAETAIAAIFAPQSPPQGYADYIGVGLTLRRETLRANAQQVNSLRPHVVDMSKEYPLIDIPVEIVHGAKDRIVPLDIHSTPLAQQIPAANLTILPDVGHMPHHVAPQAVINAIDRAAARAGLR